MAKGSEIVLTSCAGRKYEGIIKGARLPGTIVEFTSDLPSFGRGEFDTYGLAQFGHADGDPPYGPIMVLDIDHLLGKTTSDAYVALAHAFTWIPVPGDELNVLCAGTGTGTGTGNAGDHFYPGTQLMVHNSTGMLVKASGAPKRVPFVCMEDNVAVLSTGVLLHVMFTGN